MWLNFYLLYNLFIISYNKRIIALFKSEYQYAYAFEIAQTSVYFT